MIAAQFRARFGREPEATASAPGRVNLMGEHTDYNDGFVLPMAIGPRVCVAAARRADGRTVAWSEVYSEQRDLTPVVHGAGASAAPANPRWDDYVGGVLHLLAASGMATGLDLLISSGVPPGAGLSSSAALEIATARAACAITDTAWDPIAMSRLAQRAEHEFAGVQCGIMDQIAVALGRAGHAMLLDCRSLEVSPVPMPANAAIIVMDTGLRRSLPASAYNDRRAACERAVAAVRSRFVGVRALRDVDYAMLDAMSASIDAADLKRAGHVVAEMERPRRMADALRDGDLALAGALLNESHASLRDLYEVSSDHLDIACDVARAHPDCFGARLTGAGFGGCAIALVRAGAEEAFIRATQPRYEARTYKQSRFFAAQPEDGARLS